MKLKVALLSALCVCAITPCLAEYEATVKLPSGWSYTVTTQTDASVLATVVEADVDTAGLHADVVIINPSP